MADQRAAGDRQNEEEHHKYFTAPNMNQQPPASPAHTLLDDNPDNTTILEEKSLKALYRRWPRRSTPTSPMTTTKRFRRQELMAIANLAYQEGDRRDCRRSCGKWQLAPNRQGARISVPNWSG